MVENTPVGIIGYITPETRYISSPGPSISFEDEIPAVVNEASKLKSQGIEIIIALGHSGYEMDMEVARLGSFLCETSLINRFISS